MTINTITELFDLPDDSPAFIEDGTIKLHDSNVVTRGIDRDNDNGFGGDDDDEYTGGIAFRLTSGAGNFVEFDIEFGYDIPADDVEILVRDSIDNTTYVEWKFEGEVLDTINGAQSKPLNWIDLSEGNFYSDGGGYTGGDLLANTTYTLRAEVFENTEVEPSDDSAAYNIDVISVRDGRFDYFDDNEVHEPGGHLDGPETKPTVDIVAEPFSQEFNITSATLSVGLNDTSEDQRIQLTNDNGTTWLPDDGTENNTDVITADFGAASVFGTSIRGRVRLSRYGGPRNDTPRFGYLGQELSSWNLQITTNALRVIDDQTYTGSAYEVLDGIADDAGLTFVPDYVEDELRLNAFEPGSEVREVDWTVLEDNPVDTIEGYYNSITVFGPEPEEGEERLVVTASSNAEIEARGLVEGPAETRPEADTEPELTSISRSLLARGISQDRITGSITIESQFVQPGYSYPVAEFAAIDGEENPVYELQDAKYVWGDMRLAFESRDSLARAIRSIETEVRTTKRAL